MASLVQTCELGLSRLAAGLVSTDSAGTCPSLAGQNCPGPCPRTVFLTGPITSMSIPDSLLPRPEPLAPLLEQPGMAAGVWPEGGQRVSEESQWEWAESYSHPATRRPDSQKTENVFVRIFLQSHIWRGSFNSETRQRQPAAGHLSRLPSPGHAVTSSPRPHRWQAQSRAEVLPAAQKLFPVSQIMGPVTGEGRSPAQLS